MAGPWLELEDVFSFFTSMLFRLVRNPKIPKRIATVMNGPV